MAFCHVSWLPFARRHSRKRVVSSCNGVQNVASGGKTSTFATAETAAPPPVESFRLCARGPASPSSCPSCPCVLAPQV